MDWNILIDGFRSYLMLERSFSYNSIDAYIRDIEKLSTYFELSGRPEVNPIAVTAGDLTAFIYWLNDLGLDARSQARIISGIKAFYKYLLVEDIIDDTPTELLETPRMLKKMPVTLAYPEIQNMFLSIDLSTPHGTRNRAILETLYACGLRVSELVDLKLSNYYPDAGFIKIVGKGNKERIVPIGQSAIKYINIYLENIRKQLKIIHPVGENILFLNRRGKPLSRIMIFNIVKEAAQAAEISKSVSPHTFRHSFATHLIEGGADLKVVQDMLGHESIITTEIYTHLDTEYLRETILSFHPLNQKKE